MIGNVSELVLACYHRPSLDDSRDYVMLHGLPEENLQDCDYVLPKGSSWRMPYLFGVHLPVNARRTRPSGYQRNSRNYTGFRVVRESSGSVR